MMKFNLLLLAASLSAFPAFGREAAPDPAAEQRRLQEHKDRSRDSLQRPAQTGMPSSLKDLQDLQRKETRNKKPMVPADQRTLMGREQARQEEARVEKKTQDSARQTESLKQAKDRESREAQRQQMLKYSELNARKARDDAYAKKLQDLSNAMSALHERPGQDNNKRYAQLNAEYQKTLAEWKSFNPALTYRPPEKPLPPPIDVHDSRFGE